MIAYTVDGDIRFTCPRSFAEYGKCYNTRCPVALCLLKQLGITGGRVRSTRSGCTVRTLDRN